MTTRDVGHGTGSQTSHEHAAPIYIGGQTYYQAIACDGWPTGPCPSYAKAMERVTAYERCEEVSEAAPGQYSWAQMSAFLRWAKTMYAPEQRHRLTGAMTGASTATSALAAATSALGSGLHSPSWVAASDLFATMLHQGIAPRSILDAGGTMVRRRLPNTQIPTRGV